MEPPILVMSVSASGPLAESKELTLPYKTNYWEEIPDWAKDDDGDWLLSYTGNHFLYHR